jgi:hypothetical protein
MVIDEQGLSLTASELIGHGTQAAVSTPKTEKIVPHFTYAGMEAAIRDIITGLETGRPTAGPAEAGWRSAAILDAVLRSQADGNRPARIDPPSWSN